MSFLKSRRPNLSSLCCLVPGNGVQRPDAAAPTDPRSDDYCVFLRVNIFDLNPTGAGRRTQRPFPLRVLPLAAAGSVINLAVVGVGGTTWGDFQPDGKRRCQNSASGLCRATRLST